MFTHVTCLFTIYVSCLSLLCRRIVAGFVNVNRHPVLVGNGVVVAVAIAEGGGAVEDTGTAAQFFHFLRLNFLVFLEFCKFLGEILFHVLNF